MTSHAPHACLKHTYMIHPFIYIYSLVGLIVLKSEFFFEPFDCFKIKNTFIVYWIMITFIFFNYNFNRTINLYLSVIKF